MIILFKVNLFLFGFIFILYLRNELQVNHLRLGGNQSLKDFFEKYNINENSPIDFKFKTRAAEYYRNKVNTKQKT